jgi:hypothetical protein
MSFTAASQHPIASQAFSANEGSFVFSGTFDSATAAHGTVKVTNGTVPSCPYPINFN